MKISIIIPVYNVLDYLQKCLDSAYNQTLQDKEIIIVDDGSTDGSGQFVDKYAKGKKNIRVIHKPNGGLMSAWTTGVRVAQGDYIGFIDSDDYIASEMYEEMYRKAVDNDADIILSNYLVNGVRKSGALPLSEGLYTGNELKEKIQQHVFPSPYTYSLSMSRWSKLYRRKIITDNLKYTECLSKTFEDRYIVPAAILSAKSIYYTADAYYCWMLREGSNHGMYKKQLLYEIKRVYGVQYQIVLDYFPELLKKWEEAYFDYVRLYVDRNIIRVKGFPTKYNSAKELFSDPILKERVDKYGFIGKDKMSNALKLAYRLRSPLILALSSYLGKKNN